MWVDQDSEAEGASSELTGVPAFLARWSPLLEGEREPVVVLWADTLAPAWLNAAAAALLPALDVARTLREVLPSSALRAVAEEGLWRGDTALSRQPWPTVAMSIAGGRGATEGVAITWSPPPDRAPLIAPGALRQVIDQSTELVIGVDGAGRIVYRNTRARAFFPKEILGLRAQDTLASAALTALLGASPDPEETVDAEGDLRILRWQGLRVDIPGLRPSAQDSRADMVLGRDVTDETEAAVRLQNRVSRLEVMHAVSSAIGRGVPLQDLYNMAFQRLGEVVPVRQGALYEVKGVGPGGDVREDARLLGIFAWDQGEGRPIDEEIPLHSHPAAVVCVDGAPSQVATQGPAALSWPRLRSAARMGIQAVLCVPLRENDRVYGVLWLGTGRTGGFGPEDIDAADELGSLLVNAMVRQRLLDEIAGHSRELEARVAARTDELRRAQEQLVHAARLSSIGEMAAGVAHELNQPLNVLSGYIEMLSDGELAGAEQDRAYSVMARASERMATLVKHLRDFSRAGLETLRPVDLRAVLDVAVELSERASKRLIPVLWDRPPDAIYVLGDPSRIEQLFINLVANARQATEANGGQEVRLVIDFAADPKVGLARGASEAVRVGVADQGSGVPEHLRERIFEPFFTTKVGAGGTGLGLSICEKIAREHQGRIEILDAPGGGAVFRVLLPRYRPF